jgi:hypothetical protein
MFTKDDIQHMLYFKFMINFLLFWKHAKTFNFLKISIQSTTQCEPINKL